MRRVTIALVLASVAAGAVACPAGAAAPWSPADDVSGPANDLGPFELAIDARGRALATWAVYRWQSGSPRGHYVLAGWRGASRAPGAAAFSATWPAPSFAVVPVLYGVSRAVGVDERSLGWSTCGERATLRARFGTSSGEFGAPRTIVTARGPGGDPDPAIAANASGLVLAAWAAVPQDDCARSLIRVASRRPSGSSFGAMTTLRGTGRNETPSIAAGQGGDLLAAWARRIGEGQTVIEARFRPAGKGWSAVERLGLSTVAGPIRTAVAQNGRAYVAWGSRSINESTGLRASFSVAVRPAGAGAFRRAQLLERVATRTAYLPRLGPEIALAGTSALLSWTGNDGDWRVRVSESDGSGRFRTPQTVSPEGVDSALGDLAALPDGSAVVAWSGLDDEYLVHDVGAAVRSRRKAFEAPESVNPAALRAPVAALDAVSGRPTVGWAERVGPVTSVSTITAYVRASTRAIP